MLARNWCSFTVFRAMVVESQPLTLTQLAASVEPHCGFGQKGVSVFLELLSNLKKNYTGKEGRRRCWGERSSNQTRHGEETQVHLLSQKTPIPWTTCQLGTSVSEQRQECLPSGQQWQLLLKLSDQQNDCPIVFFAFIWKIFWLFFGTFLCSVGRPPVSPLAK